MKDPYFIYILDLVFLFILLISFIVINYQISIKKEIKNKEEIKNALYNIISTLFFVFLIITFIIFSSKYNIFKAFIIFNLLNVITPIPETSFMVLLPLKRVFDINMVYYQILLLLFSSIIVFLNYNVKFFNSFYFGRLFNYLLKNNKLLIVISLISSIIGTLLFQKEIDYYYKNIKSKNISILTICYFSIIIIYYSLFSIYTKNKI